MYIMSTRKAVPLVLGLLMTAAGIYCLFTPVETSAVIPFVLGAAMIAGGAWSMAAWLDVRRFAEQSPRVPAGAAVSVILGLLLVLSPGAQMSVGRLGIILTGCWILALGIGRIVRAFRLWRLQQESGAFGFFYPGLDRRPALLPGILLSVFGTVLIFAPVLGLGMIGILVGLGVMTAGIRLLYQGLSPWLL